jgi:hypothetical protein
MIMNSSYRERERLSAREQENALVREYRTPKEPVNVQANREESREMKRRAFLGLAGAAAARLGIASLGRAQNVTGPPMGAAAPRDLRLAGMSLAELRQKLYDQLFQVLLPFWDKHGIDHEYGGLMCSLDYDGTLLDTGKNLWFLGRAI